MKNDSEKSQSSSNVNEADGETRQKKIIIILAILLVLSLAGLAARFLYLYYLANTPVTVEVPDNLISDDKDKNKSDGSGTTGSAGFGVPADSPGGSSELTGGEGDKSGDDDSGKPSDNSSKDNNDDDNNNGDDPGEPDTPDNPDNPDNPGKDDDKGNNIIIPGREAIRLNLFAKNEYTNQRFEVGNMFPGDDEQQLYCIRIYHDRPTTLYFKTDVTLVTVNADQKTPLKDNLKLKVVNLGIENGSGVQKTDTVLLDGAFSSVDGGEYSVGIPYSSTNTTDVYFKINGYLPTSTGNDCQASQLRADFEWYVRDAEGSGGTVIPVKPDEPDKPDTPDKPDEPDTPDKPDKPDKVNSDKVNDGHLINPPKTGDVTNVTLWSVMTVSALLLLIITFRSRRKEDSEDDK